MANRNIVAELKVELSDLTEKKEKLEAFLKNPEALSIVGQTQFGLLTEQNDAMRLYSNILRARIIDME